MAHFRKAALKLNTYRSPDGIVEVTPERLQHWRDNFRRLSAAGYTVPISWDHATEIEGVKPLSAAELGRSAQHTIGKLAEFLPSAAGDGAELTLEISDPKAEGRAERNEVFVSPVILPNWTDGAGNQYTDVITHVDLVNHPVDYSQGPFTRVEHGAIACALRMGLSTQVYRMSTDNESEKPEEKPEDVTAPESNPDMPTGDASEDDKKREALLAHLASDGYVLPADTTAENLVDRLLTAAMTKGATKAKEEAEEEAQPEEKEQSTVADPGFAAMSLQARSAVAFAERLHRERLQERLNRSLEDGKCSPVEHAAYAGQVKAVRLSLDAAGQPAKNDLEKFLDSRDAVPKGTFWDAAKRIQMSATPVEPSRELLGTQAETHEEAEANARAVFRRGK